MKEIQKILSQLALLAFVMAILVPLFFHEINPLISESDMSENIFVEIANTYWVYRLLEVYLQLIFLGSTIIASVLVIRKPPRFDPELKPNPKEN